MQKNDTVVVEITDIGVNGEGIGKIDGYTLFIKDAVIGDVAEVKVIKAKKNYGYARLINVLEPSNSRVEPKCPFARKCGGCQIQEMSYEKQLEFKERKVRGNLERIGGFSSELLECTKEPIIGMETPFYYRNKAQFPFGTDKEGNPVTGFYAGRTHDIIANTNCILGAAVNEHILESILDFRRKIIESYPENKVIILPQSIYYDDSSLMKEDIAFYAKHLNVIICARDKYSYQFLKDRFQNEIKLVPDMAFFIDLKKYKIPQSEDRVLYLRRKDKELSNKNCSEISPVAELHDWPTIECKEKKYEYIDKLFYPIKFLCWLFGMKYRKLAEDYKRDKFYRPSYVQTGINFISKYSIVYTTRLHALILSVLLNKKIFLIDNSTGKLCNFYDTWLSDFDNIIVKNRQNLITPSR